MGFDFDSTLTEYVRQHDGELPEDLTIASENDVLGTYPDFQPDLPTRFKVLRVLEIIIALIFLLLWLGPYLYVIFSLIF